jgi:glycosyltransferase involved in cell wall biosynthesis
MKLKIAAKIDDADLGYFRNEIEQLIDGEQVQFVDEIDEAEKANFLGGAHALLFPIDWPEPFGLVAIEAMAVGTPVIAWNRGAAPEVIEHGKTGFLVESIEEAVARVRDAERLDRDTILSSFERRFSADRMTADYECVYDALLTRGTFGRELEPARTGA